MAISVASLHAYPVKGLRGHDLSHADARAEGLAGDRRWLVTDPQGRFLTQREVRAMAQISVRQLKGGIELSHADGGALAVREPGPDRPLAEVTVWRFTGPARRAAPDAEAWLSGVLGRNVHLVHMHDVSVRGVNSAYGKDTDRVSFADGYPILITSTASLENLNARGQSGHIMRQFRPNLVVSGAAPWAEDTWRLLRIGGLTLRIARPCARCIVTTLDPGTGVQMSPDGPLATLSSFHRAADGGIIFGQNAIADAAGTIDVGATVEILEAGPSNVVPPERRRDSFAR